MREQGIILEHQADAALLGRNAAALALHQPAADKDAAFIGTFEPGGDAQSGGLAGARGTDQADDLAALYVQRDMIDRKPRAEAARNAPQRQAVDGIGLRAQLDRLFATSSQLY
jgi:hypothetical protein